MNLTSFLHITLLPVKSAIGPSDTPILLASVQNQATDQITVLTYNGLLDKAAGSLGIIHVIDTSTGEEAPADVIQFQKLWPPLRDAFVEIASNQTINVHIPLATHKLETGKIYDVVASWSWQGLWLGGVDLAMEATRTEGALISDPVEVKMEGNFNTMEIGTAQPDASEAPPEAPPEDSPEALPEDSPDTPRVPPDAPPAPPEALPEDTPEDSPDTPRVPPDAPPAPPEAPQTPPDAPRTPPDAPPAPPAPAVRH